MACLARAHFGIARGHQRSANHEECEINMQAAINIYRDLMRNRKRRAELHDYYVEYLQVLNRYTMTLLNTGRKVDAQKAVRSTCKALNQYFNIPDKEPNFFEVCWPLL